MPFRPLAFLLPFILLAPVQAGVLGDDYNQEESEDYISLPRLRLSVEGGFSQWIIPDDTSLTTNGKKYVDDQQSAHNASADAVFYFAPRGGVGLTWIWFLSRTAADDLVLRAGGGPHDVRERVSIVYLGPSFWTRVHAGRFGLAHAGFGAGYLGFRNTWTDNGEANVAEAKTFALVASLGWDYSIFRFVGVGINGRFVFSNIKEWRLNGEKVVVEDPFNQFYWFNVPLYRLELNLGLRVFL